MEEPEAKTLAMAEKILGGIPINTAASPEFYSQVPDDYEAILSIIKRHPMNQHEINSFLADCNCKEKEKVFQQLRANQNVEVVDYKGYQNYRVP